MSQINIEKLPSPPGVAVRLLELFSSSDVSLNDMCEVIGVDPVLTARIVSYANSPKFARRHRAESLNQATALLGVNGVKMIALSFSLTETKSEDADSFSFQDFWKFSLATAVCSKHVFAAANQDADTGFMMGLLFNVGQLAIACTDPASYQKIQSDKSICAPGLIQLENDELNMDRYEMAIEVLKAWNFPESSIEIFRSRTPGGESGATEFALLKLAAEMSYSFLESKPDYEFIQSLNASIQDLLNSNEDQVNEYYGKALAEFSDLAEILSYDLPPQKSLLEIELEAKTRIMELTMDLHQANTKFTEENTELKNMAYVDALTGLANRRQYDATATAEYDRSSRLGLSFGILVCDIDFFKKVNDVHGHAAGDAILAGVAKRIQESVRSYDHVFRFGGEEFVVLLPDSDQEVVATVAERIRSAIEADVFEFEGSDIPVTISSGGAVFCPNTNCQPLEELFQAADEALYSAKKNGRNQYCFAGAGVANSMPVVSDIAVTDNTLQNG